MELFYYLLGCYTIILFDIAFELSFFMKKHKRKRLDRDN